MNYNHYIVFDYETSAKSVEKAQVLQIGALVFDNRTLDIKDTFQTLVKPEDWSIVEDDALKINKLTKEQLDEAPEISVAWPLFVNFVNRFNKSKGAYTAYNAPIPCGYNIVGYDLPITRRYCERFGPWDKKRNDQRLFNQINKVDLYDHMFLWLSNSKEPESLKLSSLMEWMGFPKEDLEQAHGALPDCIATYKIIRRLMMLMRRLTTPNEEGHRILEMKGAFAR